MLLYSHQSRKLNYAYNFVVAHSCIELIIVFANKTIKLHKEVNCLPGHSGVPHSPGHIAENFIVHNDNKILKTSTQADGMSNKYVTLTTVLVFIMPLFTGVAFYNVYETEGNRNLK